MTRQRAEGMGFQEDGRRYMYVSDVPSLVKGNGVLNHAGESVDSTFGGA
jgi:hypothetical protein